ncbi:MAG: hypothetical protein NT152_06710 [Actinobacteria bacterium]|nr:hypothetical protein [Actinomycetota bacterium]
MRISRIAKVAASALALVLVAATPAYAANYSGSGASFPANLIEVLILTAMHHLVQAPVRRTQIHSLAISGCQIPLTPQQLAAPHLSMCH